MKDRSATTSDGTNGSADGSRVAHVRPLHRVHAGVGAQGPRELSVADVDGDDAGGAGLQEAVGEPSGGGARVERVPPARVDVESLEGRRELLAAARDETRGPGPDVNGLVGGDEGRRVRRRDRPTPSPARPSPRLGPPRCRRRVPGARARRRGAGAAPLRSSRTLARLRGGLLDVALRGGRFLRGAAVFAPDERPAAPTPVARSRSRTRRFRASRSFCVATPMFFI